MSEENTKDIFDELQELLEQRIRGGASSVHTGDKSISYLSVDELIKLKNFLKAEQAEQTGKRSAKNGLKYKMKWRDE